MNIYKIVLLSGEEYMILCTAHEAALLVEKNKVVSITFVNNFADFAQLMDIKNTEGGD